MISKLLNILRSIKLSIALIISLSIIFLLGLWIPQKSLLGKDLYLKFKAENPLLSSIVEKIGFTDIYTSPITLILWSLFFLNLLLVMLKRISIVKKRVSYPIIKDESFSLYSFSDEIKIENPQNLNKLKRAFKGYKFFGSEDNFLAIRNRFSPVATILFHISFFILLLGGLITVYTRFGANLEIAEGESFTGGLAQYSQIITLPKIGTHPNISFLVEKIEPEVINNVPTDLKVYVRDDKKKSIIRINKPLKAKDGTYFVIKNLGIAPLFILYDKEGKEIDGAYVRLDVLRGKLDKFVFDKYTINAEFFPDFYIEGNKILTRSEEIKNPAFYLSIIGEGGFFKEGLIKPNERLSLNGHELEIKEIIYWVKFLVVKEKGLWIVYFGFLLISIACIWRLIFYRREIRGIVKQTENGMVLMLGGRSEFYKALFKDEFERILNSVKEVIKQ